jgi:hypothetical protein
MAERHLDDSICTNGPFEKLAWSALADVVGVDWYDPLLPAGRGPVADLTRLRGKGA